MKKLIKPIGYLGLLLFISISIVDYYFIISDMISGVALVISVIMFLPMCIQEVMSLKNNRT